MLVTRFVRRGMLIACGVALSCSASVFAAPPTDADIQAKVDALMKWQKETPRAEMTREKFQAKVTEIIADINVEELSLKQISLLSNMLGADEAKAEAVMKRLTSMSEDKSVDGATAAIILVSMSRSQDDMNASLKSALQHPSLPEAARTETGSQIFTFIGFAEEGSLQPLAKQVLSLQSALTPELPPAAMRGAMEYLTAVNGLGDAADAATRQSIRDKVSALYASALEKAKAAPEPNKKQIDAYENNIKFLNGAFARGELINHAAPAMTFLWSSGEPIKGLDQFKGKVVIVDFWATWCGPCIASFPEIAKLQERYADYDVVIVGVTSPQGKHYPGGGKDAIDTEGDKAKEFTLMSEFMKEKNMTWRVAFTEENVFNPDFGVRGIPHVAIIDTEGKVQFNGLHPSAPMTEKAEKIDGLLKKAGLATPGPVAEPEPAKEEKPTGG